MSPSPPRLARQCPCPGDQQGLAFSSRAEKGQSPQLMPHSPGPPSWSFPNRHSPWRTSLCVGGHSRLAVGQAPSYSAIPEARGPERQSWGDTKHPLSVLPGAQGGHTPSTHSTWGALVSMGSMRGVLSARERVPQVSSRFGGHSSVCSPNKGLLTVLKAPQPAPVVPWTPGASSASANPQWAGARISLSGKDLKLRSTLQVPRTADPCTCQIRADSRTNLRFVQGLEHVPGKHIAKSSNSRYPLCPKHNPTASSPS